jgi:hypothetical protein
VDAVEFRPHRGILHHAGSKPGDLSVPVPQAVGFHGGDGADPASVAGRVPIGVDGCVVVSRAVAADAAGVSDGDELKGHGFWHGGDGLLQSFREELRILWDTLLECAREALDLFDLIAG